MTTSYLQNNDYRGLDFLRPYDANYAGTLQELNAKTQYWEQGMQRIKSAYDKIADVNPMFEIGKEYVNKFKQEAAKKLDSIAKSDVSISDNSLAAFDVIKPLYDTSNKFNEAVLRDDALRKHYAQQDELVQGYKKSGKEYNPNNEYVYNLGKKTYLDAAKNSTDYSELDEVFSKKSSYTPYYDQSTELNKLVELCRKGGVTIEKQDVQGMFFENTKDSGLNAVEMGNCISLGKSSAAKEQDRIDGIAYYRQNPLGLQTLIRDFEKANSVDEEIVSNAKAVVQAYASGKHDSEKLEKYKKTLKQLEDTQKANKKAYLSQYENPNEFIKNNFDYLAGFVYSSNKSKALGAAFRNDAHTNKLLDNQTRLAEFNATKQFELEKLEHFHKKEEIILKGQIDLALGESKGRVKGIDSKGNPIYEEPTALDGVTDASQKDVSLTEDALRAETKNLSNQATDITKILREIRLTADPNAKADINSLDIYASEQLKKKNAPGSKPGDYDELFLRNYQRLDEVRGLYKTNILITQGINETITKGLSTKKIPVYVGYGEVVNLSDKDIYEIVNNGKTIEGVTAPRVNKTSSQIGIGGAEVITIDDEVTEEQPYSNKQIVYPSSIFMDRYLALNKTIKPKKEEFYKNLRANQSESYTKDPMMTKIKADGEVAKKIKGMLPPSITGGLDEANGFKYVASTQTGEGVYIIPLDKDKNPVDLDKSVGNEYNKGFFNAKDMVKTLPGYGKAVLLNNVNPRYQGLADDQTLAKINRTTQDLNNLATVVKANFDPKLSYQNSRSLKTKDGNPHPLAFLSYTNSMGIRHDITISKEGPQYYYSVDKIVNGNKQTTTYPITDNVTQSAAILATSINK